MNVGKSDLPNVVLFIQCFYCFVYPMFLLFVDGRETMSSGNEEDKEDEEEGGRRKEEGEDDVYCYGK